MGSDSNKKSNLYPKPKMNAERRKNANKRDLYERYLGQKKAEHEFNVLQHQIDYVEYLVRLYPHLQAYYSLWLAQAHETLKSYSNIIESPDVVSFSVSFNFKKISITEIGPI